MAPAPRKRISYVLPLNDESDGHRLGVNGLAFDDAQSVLYSAGRDGKICAWNVRSQAVSGEEITGRTPADKQASSSTYRQHVQAHTHWINDLCLIRSQSALVSASSDVSVKIWRPQAEVATPPQTIGLHTDYVKRVAAPSHRPTWIAAGGLDRKVCLWDLNGGGQRLQLDVSDADSPTKGSVYALACNESLIATGGPENVVKLWDPRSARQITKFVGHTGNIRDILISQDNDTIMTASSDKTVKIWSVTAGRCTHTLGMHNDSVWCLKSSHAELSTFYSGDRSGFVAKTDTRGSFDQDDGISIAIAHENDGVNNMAIGVDLIWTGTASSSISSWQDVDLASGVQVPEDLHTFRLNAARGSRASLVSQPRAQTSPTEDSSGKIPFSCVIRMANMPGVTGMRHGTGGGRMSMFSGMAARKQSTAIHGTEPDAFAPLRQIPLHTIEGQDGLIKHVLLNDKQRVLTLDTMGNVVMWDLLKCTIVKTFGKRDLDEVANETNEPTSIASWCSVDTRSGTLTCTIDDLHGFDAETYVDDTDFAKDADSREDARINLGRWILRYLFSLFLDEQIRRDEAFRSSLLGRAAVTTSQARAKPTMTLEMPTRTDPWRSATDNAGTTPRAMDGKRNGIMTPGLSIGLSTSAVSVAESTSPATTKLASGSREATPTDASRPSTEGGSSDYFSQSSHQNESAPSTHSSTDDSRSNPSDASDEKQVASPESTKAPGRFGKFLSNLNKSGKKLAPRSQPEEAKTTAGSGDKTEGSVEARSSQDERRNEEAPFTFKQYLEQLRAAYAEAVNKTSDSSQIPSTIVPSGPNDASCLRPRSGTTIIIQEERPEAGGAVDVFEGKIEELGQQADLIEAVAPVWLAEVLLKNRPPPQAADYNKIKFLLEPIDNQLPWVCNPNRTEHLNANRMLRARKMAAYVADKLEPADASVEADPNAIRPDAYLDLYCNNVLLGPKTTLAWMKGQLWKSSQGEMIIHYKANGQKSIKPYGKELFYLNNTSNTGQRVPGGEEEKKKQNDGVGETR